MRSPHTDYRWRIERDIEPIKWMRSPHTRYRWRGERERVIEPIKWYALTPHQIQLERREESHRANQVYALTNNTSYRWSGERERTPPPKRQSSVWAHLHQQYRLERRERERDIETLNVYALTTQQLTGGEERSDRGQSSVILSPHTRLQVREGRERQRKSSVCLSPTPDTGGEERES